MPQQPEADWSDIVRRVQERDPDAEEVLYRTLATGARQFLQRRLGVQDVEDRVHDLFLTVVGAIRRGQVEYPERLMGFVRTLLYRQLSGAIGESVRTRSAEAGVDTVAELPARESSPEEQAISAQKLALMRQVLREMSERDVQVLTRFYLRDQPSEQIQREMGITQVQYQLLKSRAKARLADLIRRKLERS